MAKKKSGADLAARFAKLSESITTEAEKALFDIAVIVRDDAKRRAPVKTGTLRDSIAIRMRYAGTEPRAVIGTVVPYATFVEFAKTRNGKPWGTKLPEPARVLYAAMDANQKIVNEMIAAAVARGIKGGVEVMD